MADITGIRIKGIHTGLRFNLISSAGILLCRECVALTRPLLPSASPGSVAEKRYRPIKNVQRR